MSDDETTTRPRRARPKRDDASARDVEVPRKKRRRADADTDASSSTEAHAARTAIVAVDPPRAPSPSFESVRRPLVGSAVAAGVGLAIVGTSASPIGPWVLAAGLIGLVASIHRLGRLGPA